MLKSLYYRVSLHSGSLESTKKHAWGSAMRNSPKCKGASSLDDALRKHQYCFGVEAKLTWLITRLALTVNYLIYDSQIFDGASAIGTDIARQKKVITD